eukprot:881257-Rhodomonas_salina.1
MSAGIKALQVRTSNVFASVVPDVPSLAMELPVCELSLVFRLALPPRHDTLSVKFQSAQITDIPARRTNVTCEIPSSPAIISD